jgi:Flp pilus assembly protein TadD
MKKKDYGRVITDCNEAIRLNPNDAGVYQNREIAYANKEDYARTRAIAHPFEPTLL